MAIFRALAALLALALLAPAQAAPCPDRPATLVVPFEAGGSTDVSARVVAKALSEVLRQPVMWTKLHDIASRPSVKAAEQAEREAA